MKRLFMVLFGLASLHAAATAAKTAGEEKTPGKNAGAAASLWPEKMDPSFQGSRPECFKIWVIRNLRFPADRYDVGDEAKVEVVFAIDKNGTLTDLNVYQLLFTPFTVTRCAMHRNHALHDFAPQLSGFL